MISRVWRDLREQESTHIQKRVSSAAELKIFGCIDADGRLGVRFEGKWKTVDVPQFRFIGLKWTSLRSGLHELELTLADESLLPLFGIVCDDLIAAVGKDGSSINIVIERLIHWKHLLDDPSYGSFNVSKTRGLLGELLTLERVANRHDLGTAILAWSGPTATPQDFYLPTYCLEVKSVGPGAKRVEVNAVEQLDPASGLELYLCVLMLNESTEANADSVSLNLVIRRIADRIDNAELTRQFYGRLQCIGWTEELPLNDLRFVISWFKVFNVCDNFPRLRSQYVPSGISFLKYNVELSAIAEFEATSILENKA